jgi:hypothetical protein
VEGAGDNGNGRWPCAASINTTRSNLKDKASLAFTGKPHVPILPFAAAFNTTRLNLKDRAACASKNYNSAKCNDTGK